MDIVVCIKRVPATDTAIKIAADGKSIETSGVTFEMNAYDEFALEQARLLKEQLGEATVTAITIGPKEAQKEMRGTLARGADKAVLLTTEHWVYDGASTAEALSTWIKANPAQIVLCGKQATDADNNQMASNLAARLGYGCVTEVSKLELAEGTFTAERDIEGAREVVTCKTPAVISCNKGLNEPKPANLKSIMAAKKKPLEEMPAELPDAAMEVVSLELPPPRAEGKIIGEGADAVPALIELLRNEAKAI
ncbi:MAG: electron transfer flavoprotein subunit beta [Planctomycetes bacterium]|nr:electron transfer flavoprotein subunit beta [Planctomycetota bacterium]|tara:strand:+ start:32 stop:784 length:753 start_codon:yes stop_codon:yes gene_type:complete